VKIFRSSVPTVVSGAEQLPDEILVPPIVYEMPAWGISLLLHLSIVLLLASVGLVTNVLEPDVPLQSEIIPEEILPEEFAIAQNAEVLGSDSHLNVPGPSLALAQQEGDLNHREEIQRLEEKLINPAVPEFESLPTPNEAELLETIDLTGTTEFAGGTEGAIDRITQEIAASLRQRQTLVVWLFDESLSLKDRRGQIAERFESIYRQLGLMEDVHSDEALRTAIIGYGQGVHALQVEPTNDIEKLVDVVQKIQSDESGQERVFAAGKHDYHHCDRRTRR
jgi:hypothetical protein